MLLIWLCHLRFINYLAYFLISLLPIEMWQSKSQGGNQCPVWKITLFMSVGVVPATDRGPINSRLSYSIKRIRLHPYPPPRPPSFSLFLSVCLSVCLYPDIFCSRREALRGFIRLFYLFICLAINLHHLIYFKPRFQKSCILTLRNTWVCLRGH